MGVFSSLSHLEQSLPSLLTHFKAPSRPLASPAIARAASPKPDASPSVAASNPLSSSGSGGGVPSMHVLNVAVLRLEPGATSAAVLAELQRVLGAQKDALRRLGVRRVTALVVTREGQVPDFYTFKEKSGYKEDPIYRHIEPPLAYHLELRRLREYAVTLVPTDNKQLHLYRAKAPTGEERLFVRALVRKPEVFNTSSGNADRSLVDLLLGESERVLVEAMHALEMQLSAKEAVPARAGADSEAAALYNHHIFLKILPEAVFEPTKVMNIIHTLGSRHGRRLWRLRVGVMEVVLRLTIRGVSTPLRFIITNPSGYYFHMNLYREDKDRAGNCTLASFPPGSPQGPMHGKATAEPYPRAEPLQRKRYLAQNDSTTYVYDFLDVFRAALEEHWAHHLTAAGLPPHSRPEEVVKAVELVLDGQHDGDGLREVSRAPGLNDVGMVAWRLTLYSPEAPAGRQVILVANDITHQIGSFGPDEDELFRRASVLARKLRVPRLYLAANSGARIGLASEVREAFRVAWNKPDDPLKGFAYLYLTQADHLRLHAQSVQCTKVDGGAEERYRITDVIGAEHGLGVENLRGSGAIAGETSRAYDEIFTITLVTGRTVGIGAYLVRLGQRAVQNEGPIILTGAPALNKVLGREVYSSNVQLGGPQIMYTNGVSHVAVNDELKGVAAIVAWLAYVPVHRGAPLPRVLPLLDPVSRPIAFTPSSQPYDPRHMLAGHVDTKSGEWISGFFDRGSWTETLAGWARTVVCGRARLGGLPCAIVATESRTVEKVTPADPANPESRETVVQQAGGVWFPDSAFKTAQAIKDFAREDLPLFIFANWRGFSGGMRDMYDEVLKYGSYIVDALRDYAQPVFVYLPPAAELRGGAWVVLDPTINLAFMEMYADETSRGGVLEASGTVEIKYRKRDLIRTMRRLDPVLIELLKQPKSPEAERAIAQREELLLPMYQQVAFVFADLHDTPGRMKAKGAINGVVAWRRARTFFHARLCRRLAEVRVLRRVREALPATASTNDAELLRAVLRSVDAAVWADDEALAARLAAPEAEREVDEYIKQGKVARAAEEIAALAATDVHGTLAALAVALNRRAENPAVAALLKGLGSLQQLAMQKP